MSIFKIDRPFVERMRAKGLERSIAGKADPGEDLQAGRLA